MEVDLSRLDFATATKVDELLRHDFNKTVMEAARRQQRIAAFHSVNQPWARDGMGGQTISVDPVFDAMWRIYYGYDYSENKDLVRFLTKRNPEIAVKSRGTKIMVGWAAGSQSKRPVGVTVKAKG